MFFKLSAGQADNAMYNIHRVWLSSYVLGFCCTRRITVIDITDNIIYRLYFGHLSQQHLIPSNYATSMNKRWLSAGHASQTVVQQ